MHIPNSHLENCLIIPSLVTMMNTWTRRLSLSLVDSAVSQSSICDLCKIIKLIEYLVYEDPDQSSNERVEELENENERLRRRLATLEREMNSQSPTRKPRAKQTSPNKPSNLLSRESDIENALQRMNQLHLTDGMFIPSSPTSPGKKPRKISTRKWDLAPESDI